MKLSKTNMYCFIGFFVSIPMVIILKGTFGEWLGGVLSLGAFLTIKNTYQAKIDKQSIGREQ